MFLGLVIDMGGEFGLRTILFPVCTLLLMMTHGLVFPKTWLIPFGILAVYPTISLLIGILDGAQFSIAISQYQSTVLAFVIFILISRIPYEVTMNALLYSLFTVAVLAIGLAAGLVIGVDVIIKIVQFMAEQGGGYFGERSVGIEAFIPNVYFKATLFLVPSFTIALITKRNWIAIACFLALITAVSKTGMAVTSLITLIYISRNVNRKEFIIYGTLLALAIAAVMMSPIFFLFEEISRNDSGTLNVRAGHFNSIIEVWSNNPINLLFGFGLGSTFYSSGAGKVVSNIEIDHLNVIRKYGLLWGTVFFFWVMQVAFSAIRNRQDDVRSLGWGLLVAFLVAGTNPVLISPIFFLFLFIAMNANYQISSRNSK